MQKKTFIKLGAFVASAAATAALVGFAANGTGAYFSSSTPGHLSVSTGSVSLSTSDVSALDFTNLIPGDYVTEPVTYRATGTTAEDVYIEFNGVNAFQEVPTPGPTPLGRYGHLEVKGADGEDFSSFNLADDPADPALAAPVGTYDTGDCVVDAYGRVIANPQPAYTPTTDFCPAPKFILVSWDITNGSGDQTANITFGFTPKLGNAAQGPVTPTSIPFSVVAIQHGVLPTDPNSGVS